MRMAKREAFRVFFKSSACQNHYHLFSEEDASRPVNVMLMLLKWYIMLYTEFGYMCKLLIQQIKSLKVGQKVSHRSGVFTSKLMFNSCVQLPMSDFVAIALQ